VIANFSFFLSSFEPAPEIFDTNYFAMFIKGGKIAISGSDLRDPFILGGRSTH
jgi:hypothetical protein